MRAKKTWTNKEWSRGRIVENFPDLRRRHGDAIADIIETYAELIRCRRERPSMQDVKHTLRAIADAPAQAELLDLDALTRGLLTRESFRLYREPRPWTLPAGDVATCARGALGSLNVRLGRPEVARLTEQMVAALIPYCHGWSRNRCRDLIREARGACGLKGKAGHGEPLGGHAADPWDAVVRQIGTPAKKEQATVDRYLRNAARKRGAPF